MKINNFYEKRYDKSLGIGEVKSLSTWQSFTYKDIIKEIGNKNSLNILEIGVGPYGMIFKLKKEYSNNNYIGVDLDDNVLDFLNSNDFKGIKSDISSEKIEIEIIQSI